MNRSGRRKGRLGSALIASALLHGGAIAFLYAFASQGATIPQLRAIAVEIVSPPPREAGEPAPERLAAAETPPEPVEAAPQPTPEPPPPAPPTPPRREPAPTPPRETQPTPQPQREPSTPPRPTSTPTATEQPRPAPSRPAASPARESEPAARPAPSTGPAPSATSPGGENLAIRTEGASCPSQEYCNNIAAQVQRYFRRPPDSYSDRGDVCFRIARDGSVDDLEVQRLRGSFAFRLALMEAVEQAGRRDEFGPLPRAFGSDWLPVCVGVSPQL